MKIRINRDSVRYRLSKSEVEQLAREGFLEDHTSFGESTFSYAIQTTSDSPVLSATFRNDRITLLVPASFLRDWAGNNVTGTDAHMPIDQQKTLYLLLEKDFKCLDNVAEDQSDNYENPNKTC